MDADDSTGPLLEGRGLLPFHDFCRSSGLDPATAAALVRAGEIEGAVDLDGRVVGVYEDALPTAKQFHALGLSGSTGYDAEALKGSYDDRPGDPDEDSPA